ncbi:lipopolysaccharide biosynthesis protein [Limnohabitans sp. 2KL-3]|uniref:lipopolysaccharide biosynthesis protein n=1 Tax=Limnohabitans sp. 2KL-3 TaxID=1100700 RepID=UPI000AB8F84F|nr:oligosaccharide flippase family protein [Limnohabitans sp. 2KL-3]
MSRLQRLLSRLKPQNALYRSILVLSGGTALAQLIGICSLPLVTRLYTPAEIGTVSLFLSFFGFWVTGIALRYEQALMIAADDAESHVVHRLATILVVLMSVLGVPVLWLLQQNHVLEFQLLPVWAPLIAWPILLGYGLFMVYRSWALRGGLVSQISQASIVRAGAIAGTKLGLGAFGGGVVALFAAELAGALSSMHRLMQATKLHFAASKPSTIGYLQLHQAGLRYAKFPMLDTPSAWLDALAATLPLPMVASLYGAEAAGWFGLARLVLSLPNAQIGAAVADVFQMSLAEAVRDKDPQRARSVFYMLLKKLGLIGLVPLVVSLAVLPWAFPIVFGQSWAPAGTVAASLAPWLYSAFVISPLSRALPVLQAQEWKLFYDVTALVLMIGCYFLASHLALSLVEFCLLVSLAQALGYVAYALVLYLLVESRLQKK